MSLLTLLLLAATPDAGAAEPRVLDVMKAEAKAYAPLVKAPWVKQFMTALTTLPAHPPRVFFHTADKSQYFTEAEAAADAGLTRREVDDEIYYGRITEPMGYARALDVLAAQGFSPKGKKVVDYGYGNIGQLKALQSLGATVHGIEVDALLPLLYAKEQSRTLVTHHGFFPTDAAMLKALGTGYDLFISKNTLKKGYIHPERALTEAQEKRQIKLGVSDEKYVSTVFDLLAPGGFFYLYNICPAEPPEGEPFIPWSDGRSPFTRETYEQAGFQVLAFDVDDSADLRKMAKAFGWDLPSGGDPGTDLEKNLFAKYTLLKKPKR